MTTDRKIPSRAGHRAAEAWYIDFDKRAVAADGYGFPSNLHKAFTELPVAERCHFLDAIGALLVAWRVYGEPTPGRQNLAEECHVHTLPPAEQDAWGTDELQQSEVAK